MSSQDRDRWQARYAHQPPPRSPTPLLDLAAHWLPESGVALDWAGGSGRNALWLARRGLTVTVADIAPAGLALAVQRAAAQGLYIDTVEVDLAQEAPPPGPFEVLLCCDYLDRGLYGGADRLLAEGGVLVVAQATRSNRERHEHPSARWLVGTHELPTLIGGLEILHYSEAWRDNGRHEAWMVARQPQFTRTGTH
jgi:SAM-dependent methyltransferase